MKKTNENLLIELHTKVEILKTETKNILKALDKCQETIDFIKETNIKQNGGIASNQLAIRNHLKYHDKNETIFMWKFGIIITLLMFIINLTIKYFPK